MFRNSLITRLAATSFVAFMLWYVPGATVGAPRTPTASDPQGYYDESSDVSWGGDEPVIPTPGAPVGARRTGKLHQEYHVHFWLVGRSNDYFALEGTYQFQESGNSTTILLGPPSLTSCTMSGTIEGSGRVSHDPSQDPYVFRADPEHNAYYFKNVMLPGLKSTIKRSGPDCKAASTVFVMDFGGVFKISQEGDRVWRRHEGGGPCDPHKPTATTNVIQSDFEIGFTGVRCTQKFSWRFVQAARPPASAFLPFPAGQKPPVKSPAAAGGTGSQTWSIAGQGTSGSFTVSVPDGDVAGQMALANSGKFTVGTAQCTVPSPLHFEGTLSNTSLDLSGNAVATDGSAFMVLSGNGTTDAVFPKATSAKGSFTMMLTCGGASQSVPAPFTAKRVK